MSRYDRFRHPALGLLAVGGALVLVGCSGSQGGSQAESSSAQGSVSSAAAVPGAKANTASQACAPFPAADIPPDPTPPYNPGDPTQPASLAALQDAVATAAQQPQYSKTATMCAEGMDQAPVCDVDYWNVGGLPGKEEDCNFFYMRVVDEYWKGLTPLVLSEYTGYLGVTADGKDPPTRTPVRTPPSPSTTARGSRWQRGSAAAQFTTASGALDAANVAGALTAALAEPVTSSSLGGKLISPRDRRRPAGRGLLDGVAVVGRAMAADHARPGAARRRDRLRLSGLRPRRNGDGVRRTTLQAPAGRRRDRAGRQSASRCPRTSPTRPQGSQRRLRRGECGLADGDLAGDAGNGRAFHDPDR